MAQLKDTVVSGSLRATDTLYSTTAQFQILRAPTASNGTTYGPGTNGNFLKSNGTSVYWASLSTSDIPTLSIIDKTNGTLTVARGGTGATDATGARTNLGLGSMATETATNYLKWQTTTKKSTELYDFGAYINKNQAEGTGPAGSKNYFSLLNIPYNNASGNNQIYYGWQIGGNTDNNNRLFFRTSGTNTANDWQEIAHATSGNTDIGSATQPVYMTSTGVITAGTALKALAYKDSLVVSDIPELSTDKLTSGTLPVGRGGTGQTSIANIQAGKDGNGNTISSTYLKVSGGTLTGILHITPATGEGGELRLDAATSEVTKNSIILDNYYGAFRIFGGASADGTTRTGVGTPLIIDPYDKTITGGYNFDGNSNTATKFASAQTISLTGDITGSTSSTGGWSIATTIGAGKVTNAMLAGSITNEKLTNSSITVGNKTINLGGSGSLHDILKSSTNIGKTTSWDIYDPGVYYVGVGSQESFEGTNGPENDNTVNGITPYHWGQLIVSRAGTGGIAQFYISHMDSWSSIHGIHYRTGWNNSYYKNDSTSIKWSVLLDSSNYTNWTVTKTGGGASGTWEISITGNSGMVRYQNNNLTFSKTNFNISENWERNMCWFGDSSDNGIGRVNFLAKTNGTTQISLQARAWNTTDNTFGSFLGISVIGNRDNTVSYTVNTPINFRNAIGASSGTWPVSLGGTGQTTIANIQAGKDGDGNTISSTYLKLSGGTLTGNLTIGQASDTAERQIMAYSAAGRIYLFTQGSATGSKGLYSYNASGTGGGILGINQSNQISSLADINTNVNITNGGVKIKSTYDYSDLPSTGSLNTSLLYMSDNTSAAYHNVYSSLSSTGTKTFYIMTREPGDELKTYIQFGIKLDSDGSPGFSLSAKNNGESTNAAAQAAFRSTIAAVAKAGDTMTGGLIVSLAKGTEDHFIARATGYTNSAKLDVSLEVGNGKTNHGIYSTGYSTDGNAFTSDPKWMIYRNNAGTIIVNGNCTGTSANVTGTVAINNGGTGRTSWGVNQVVITDANGALSQTTSVPVTRGGTGATTATAYPGLRNLGLKIKKVTTGWTSNTNGNIDLGISGNRYQVLCVYDASAGYIYIPYLASNSKWSAHVLSNTGAVQKSVGISGTWWCLYLDYGSAPAAT